MTKPNELLPAALMPEPPFTDVELTHELDGLYPEGVPSPARHWEIENERSAEWAMRKLAAFKVELAERLNEATWYRQQIDRWLEAESRDAMRSARHFENLLADFAYRVRTESDSKVKTVKLPSGEVTTRGSDDGKVTLDDKETFIEWVSNEVPLTMRHLFTRPEPLPITELRKAVAVTRVLPHVDITFSDGHVLGVALGSSEFAAAEDWMNDNRSVICSVCAEPNRTIRSIERMPEAYVIRVHPDALLGFPAEFNPILDDPIPGLTYELGDYSVVVKPYV